MQAQLAQKPIGQDPRFVCNARGDLIGIHAGRWGIFRSANIHLFFLPKELLCTLLLVNAVNLNP